MKLDLQTCCARLSGYLVFVVSFQFLLPQVAFSQGETTSAIVGQVSDASGAAVPGATVTITNQGDRTEAQRENR